MRTHRILAPLLAALCLLLTPAQAQVVTNGLLTGVNPPAAALVIGGTAYPLGSMGSTQCLALVGSSITGRSCLTSGSSLGGQLGGTIAAATVLGVTESGGPTALQFGAVSDGQLIQRSGSNLVGVSYSPVGTYTWANLLATAPAASNTGAVAIVSDLNYSLWVSDGSKWKPVGGRALVYSRHRPDVDSLTGITAVETQFSSATPTLPANLLNQSVNASVEFDVLWEFSAVGASNATKIKVNGLASSFYVTSSTTNRSFRAVPKLFNYGNSTSTQRSTGSLVTSSGVGGGSSALTSFTLDETAAISFTFFATPTASGDTVTLSALDIYVVIP